ANWKESQKIPLVNLNGHIKNHHFLEAMLMIFDMLIQVNQRYLLAPFPVSEHFFSGADNLLQKKNLLKSPTFTQINSYQGK
ncbi:hypothetical protein K443DRAFT_90736, partial [Laccaria amethystina LaAM-08-1]